MYSFKFLFFNFLFFFILIKLLVQIWLHRRPQHHSEKIRITWISCSLDGCMVTHIRATEKRLMLRSFISLFSPPNCNVTPAARNLGLIYDSKRLFEKEVTKVIRSRFYQCDKQSGLFSLPNLEKFTHTFYITSISLL